MSRGFQAAGWVFVATVFAGMSVQAQQQPTLSNVPGATAQMPQDLVQAKRLIDADQFHEAADVLRSYLQQDDLSGDAHEMLAYALLRLDKPGDSLKEYTRAASLQRPSAEMLVHVAQDYVLLNDLDDAGKWLLRAVEMNPHDPDAWYNLGRLRYQQQRFADAKACFEKSLQLAPRSVKAENNLGVTYEALNQNDKAMAAYRQAIAWQELGPVNEKSEQPLLNLATMLLHQNQVDEAEPLLLEAAKLAPKDSHLHEQLGHLYLQEQKYPQAQKEFEQACQLAPQQSSLHFLLGQAYRHEGMQKQAQEQFALAARLAQSQNAPGK